MIRNRKIHKSHGQVNCNCPGCKRVTCRKTGLWDGSLGCSLFSKTKEETGPGTESRGQAQTTRPGKRTRQRHQAPGPPTSGHKTSPHKRATTARTTWVRLKRQCTGGMSAPLVLSLLPGQRTDVTSAPVVPLCCLPPAEFGRPLLSEVANSAVLPLFLYCRTHVIPMTQHGRSTVREFL